MPVADLRGTAAAWAGSRLIDTWVVALDGLPGSATADLVAGLGAMHADGARLAVIVAADGQDGGADLAAVVDRVLPHPGALSARALTQSAWLVGAADMRRLGVIVASGDLVRHAAATGAGAVVLLHTEPGAAGRDRTWTQADAIVRPADLAVLDAERWGRRRAHRQRVLLNPGPTVVTDRVHRAIAGPDLCHREPEYAMIATRVRTHLLAATGAGAGWQAVLLGGSGTTAMEAMVQSCVRPGRGLLVVRNGTYGDRLATMAARAGIARTEIECPVTEPVDPAAIGAALDADPSIDTVAVVHHETTTGLLNPVAEIAAVCRTRGRLLAVDAISAIGAEELALDGTGPDLVAGTANKCLHGLPGVSFVLLSPAGTERARHAVPTSLSLDLALYLDAAERGSVPFTPPIPAVYALDAALEELLQEGPAERRAFYRARVRHLDSHLERLGLSPVVAPDHRSSSIRAIRLPDGVTYARLHAELKGAGFVIYAGMGPAAAEQFRVCLLGAVGLEVVDDLADALEQIVRFR